LSTSRTSLLAFTLVSWPVYAYHSKVCRLVFHQGMQVCIPEQLNSFCSRKFYRSHINVGRILYRVATLRNIANDLLGNKMIKSLMNYGVGTSNNTFDSLNAGRLLLKGGGKTPLSAEIQVQTPRKCTTTTHWQVSRTKDGQKVRVHRVSKAKKTTNCSITDRLPWNHRCEHTFFRTMARSAAKSSSVFGSALDHAAQLFALKAALSLHYLLFFNSGRSTNNKAYYFHKGSPILCPARHSVSCHLEHI